ncbi:helix-turn-helix domain-containing protein [Streptomyces rubellomurinus]|uniref:HTH cro/C1-type domain-containing protein n=1 Tax=Streptomyces rubellomurinus (strain ATCC 31215) TaxID=359131 RepID=A0A0F2TGV0_STRR3|nr:helix-turn-helix transcriptional regulator [Streptomyces rubellomurinus]KJS62443.1 hypothetical protein VM95_08600 [Streptomyces rubellomurinus]
MPAPELTIGGMTPREYYAAELKRLREAMVPKMSQEKLAALVFVSAGYIGQLETMARVPQIELSRRIDKALNTGGQLERLHLLLGFTKFVDDDYFFANAADHEAKALAISEYAGQTVPGLLQTAEYARALFLESATSFSEDRIDQMIATRTGRGQRLTAPDGPELWFILDEAVLRRAIGSCEIMAKQLHHVADLARDRRIDLQVVPFAAGAHSMLSNGLLNLMTFADAPPIAYSESSHSGQLLDDVTTVVKIRRAFDLMRAAALSKRASLDLVRSVAEEYEVSVT